MEYGIVIALSYLLGSLSSAFFLSRLQGVDLKKGGSGNLGASNATVLLGWRVGVTVALLDIGKGVLAVLLAQRFFPGTAQIGVFAGVSAVLGHIFPFYLRFRGGKGFATYIGMTLALNWKLGLCMILLALVITLVTQYIALGTLSVSLAAPVWLCSTQPVLPQGLVLLLCTAVIFCKHTDNLSRIRAGTEIKLGRTLRGKDRIK